MNFKKIWKTGVWWSGRIDSEESIENDTQKAKNSVLFVIERKYGYRKPYFLPKCYATHEVVPHPKNYASDYNPTTQ